VFVVVGSDNGTVVLHMLDVLTAYINTILLHYIKIILLLFGCMSVY